MPGLAHLTLYRHDAPAFNEAVAEAVAEEGVHRWYEHQGPAGAFERFERDRARRQQFHGLLARTRTALAAVYSQNIPPEEKQREKIALFHRLQISYQRWKARWNGYSGYDAWMAQPLNNAHLALVATYHRLVPAFRRLLVNVDGQLPRFYDAARRIGQLAPSQRRIRLERLADTPISRTQSLSRPRD